MVTIEKLVYGGAGLARVDGEAMLVPYVLPGEQAEVKVAERRGGIARAELVSVAQPSPERVLPGCEYFGRCGGCQYQHASYPYQVAQKVEILREQFRRIGKIEAPAEIATVTGPEWGYRNRVQLHAADGAVGYLEAGTHRLCPVTHCPISSPKLNEAIRDIRLPRFVRTVELFTNENDIQINVLESDRPVSSKLFQWTSDAIDCNGFRVSRNSFFQVNRFLIDALVETATAGLSGETAFDLYAGVGLFTRTLTQHFGSVTAVESGTMAVADLEHNVRNARIQRADVAAFLSGVKRAPDAVLADPPRAGLGKAAIAELVRLRPATVVVIACDPSTLARDAAALLRGGYALDKLTLVDLFPQTFHMETVAVFRHL